MPVRIQRLRTPGWRMPAGTIYVGRPTPWGNPFPVSDVFSRADAVRMYRELVLVGVTWWGSEGDRHKFTRKASGPLHVPTVDEIRRLLAGRDLACWCPTDEPCHADVLLDLANPVPDARVALTAEDHVSRVTPAHNGLGERP